ncbi:regulatory protein, arsR family [Streptomyces sp. LamerLS-316]|uniref:ArsR/SmtB family transcription factor n=1 Tax=unclassified Streptomyces TaxID=2593676 RepID=UPI000823C051|nr:MULTISPECIES: winged helix-turn-helix domain-containing protein [unclassified Streptomyces]MYQ40233.1 ArsR family transcriptional regulator [Streptomyces sp. SID4921]SCK14060.1 regulatory protein, arsR family [Streptomyces sp. LamerLS-316]
MGWWQVNADTLAAGRFVVSELAETTATLQALEVGAAANPAERAWLDTHRPAYRERLADDPVTAQLVRTGLGGHWNADFLTPPPVGGTTFAQDLDRVRGTSPDSARADLEVSGGGPLPAALHRPDLPEIAAGLLEWVWERIVLPDWPRRRRIIEADIVARAGQLGQGGWAAVLETMNPGMRWLGGSRLQVNPRAYPPRELVGVRLAFVPVTPRRGWVSWDADAQRYAVVYACSGTLSDADRPVVPDSLGRLLGPARAGVLVLLDRPRSTTELVALTGQGLGSVGRHLKVLLDAGLAGRRRSGRSVLYFRTEAGEVLLRAQPG